LVVSTSSKEKGSQVFVSIAKTTITATPKAIHESSFITFKMEKIYHQHNKQKEWKRKLW
jgi:hypothetical protein